VVSYTTTIEHDGRTYSITVPDLEIPRCSKCGAMVRDDASNRRISDALRQQIGLLTPEQIRQNRDALDLSQKQLSGMLGIAESTLSRWETGAQIQQRAMDRLLRLFFEFPEFCVALEDEASIRKLGETVRGNRWSADSSKTLNPTAEWTAPAWSVIVSLLALRTHELPNRLRESWEERKNEIADSFAPLFKRFLTADRNSINLFRSCYEAEFPATTAKKALESASRRWFVAPLRAAEPDDPKRAALIALVAETVDKLPQEKKDEALEHLRHLVELMRERPATSSRRK
jgi:putative zinc finger/helix-turn-helix YgiT family protein